MEHNRSFVQKVWITVGITALVVVILMLLKATFSVLLLVLAGALIAIYFRGLGQLIKRKTGWKEGLSVTISVVGTFLLIGLFFWLLGAKVQTQVQQLSQSLPETIDNAKNWLNQSQLGSKVVKRISSSESQKRLESIAGTFFKSTFGVLGDIYVVLLIGIFFTAGPKLYSKGIVKLIPTGGKDSGNQVLEKIGSNLKKWLKGKIFAMAVVAVLTAVGLLIMGVPMWLALALIAGLLNFIPNFGPLIALIPAVLIGLSQSPATAAWVAGLYIFVQILESNFITPLVQNKLVSVPPAMIIIAQLLMAPLSGGWGLVVATPLLVIIMTVVEELYVKRQQS